MIRRHHRLLSAFSLIEVLISVLVLALGLLGLGAMFPVVIRQQRNATDAVLGTMAANAAKLELESNGRLRGQAVIPATSGGPIGEPLATPPWQNVLDTLRSSPSTSNFLALPTYDSVTGVMRVGEGASVANIPLASRLFPAPSQTGAQPRYVWDLAYRVAGSDRLEVFIFVRPIDPNIRITPGQNLSNVLAPTNSSGDLLNPTKLAVAVDRSTRLPTLAGVGDYSVPVEMQVASVVLNDTNTTPDDDRNRISLSPSGSVERALASTVVRTGQRLVDRLGTIYTVVGIPKSSPREFTVLVEPPIPSSVANARDIGPVYFVPQTPAAVTKVMIIP
ncbi:MAG: hypothetical protein KF705_09270 [Phycisphaeraceae bacterium]|nr:hypothetical protein [Phycisphaeraceae bacterium]